MSLEVKNPDISLSIPINWRDDIRDRVGSAIDNYLSEHGIRLSENNVGYWIKTDCGGEAAYHVRGNTVLVRTKAIPQWSVIPDSYNLEIFIEGDNKSQLIEEIDSCLTGFKMYLSLCEARPVPK